MERLLQNLKAYQEHFTNQPDAASELLSVGESEADQSLNRVDLAAWTLISHLLFNLSETITRG